MIFDEANQALIDYQAVFNEPIPDIRSMSPEDAELVAERAKEALDRGFPMTDEEWGVETDIPAEVTI
jgi:hypothetical protein